MVSKNINNKKRVYADKHILTILIFLYIIGISVGSIFIFSIDKTDIFLKYNNAINTLLYFVIAITLKYSGVLSCTISFLPLVLGIQNSAYYCNCLLNYNNKVIFELILSAIKDTSIVMLLILYIIVIISQILNNRYNIKKDFKYFITYFIGVNIIIVLDFIIKSILKL